jgi:transposase InsO family protein
VADSYEIAAWRFEQIAPFLDPSLDPARRRNAMQERCRHRVTWPMSEARRRRGEPPKEKPIARSTLHRWVKAFEKRGYAGLFPKRRQDRGQGRRPGLEDWIPYALGLLYEQPHRSLTQLETYLRLEFSDYDLGRSTLNRHLKAHAAYAGIAHLRTGQKSRLRDLYEANHPHECWQLDGKGPFRVYLKGGGSLHVHVLSVLDDFTRAILACVVALAEDTEATVQVFKKAVLRWGLADRFQFDRGSAFDSQVFRHGIAQLGVHRNYIKPRNPEADGKIEAYHRSLERWFVRELRAQEVVDLDHLQDLLEALIALLYNRHRHRSIRTTPEKRLAGEISSRRVSAEDLAQAFFLSTTATSHRKTGQVKLPNGSFRVPRPYAGQRLDFRYDPVSSDRAVLLTRDGREIDLEAFRVKPLPPAHPPKNEEKCGTGQLQKLLDVWQGKERPLAQPGFGLPEVFAHLGSLLGRTVPEHEREAREILAFYHRHGPLPREPFERACRRTKEALGPGRPLTAYLEDLARQIEADARDEEKNDPGAEEDAS